MVLPALAGALGALLACSSNSPSSNPPVLGACAPVDGVMCGNPVAGGGASPPSDGGVFDSGVVFVTEAGTCTGANQIFTTPGSSCANCIATACCFGPTSCPNDPACISVAACIATSCLANDQSCLATCQSAAPTGTLAEFTAFQQCTGTNCPGCPLSAAADL